MAVLFNIGPGHDGLNLDLCEEVILVHAVESLRPRVPGTERWLSEFDALFYDSDRGLSLRFLNHINRHLRRLRRPTLNFEETGWTDYMHLRAADKVGQRQRCRDAFGTPLGEEHLTWAESAVAALPPSKTRRTNVLDAPPAPSVPPEPPPMRLHRQIPVLDGTPDEALFDHPEAPAQPPAPPQAPVAPVSAEQIAEVLDAVRRIEQSIANLTSTVATLAQTMERRSEAPRRSAVADTTLSSPIRSQARPNIIHRVIRRMRGSSRP